MTTREKYKLRLKKKLFLTYIRTMRTKKNININRVHTHLNIRYFCRIMYIMSKKIFISNIKMLCDRGEGQKDA